MYSNETKDQFLERRARGLSLARIASDLHVSQRTLADWSRQLAPDIRALRAVHEQTLASREADLARLAKVQTNVEAAITKRDFTWVDSDKLVRIYLDLRHEIRDLRAADLSPLYEPPDPNPNPNPSAPSAAPPPLSPATGGSTTISPPLQQTTNSIPHSALCTPHFPVPPPDDTPSPSPSASAPSTQNTGDCRPPNVGHAMPTVDCLPAEASAKAGGLRTVDTPSAPAPQSPPPNAAGSPLLPPLPGGEGRGNPHSDVPHAVGAAVLEGAKRRGQTIAWGGA